METEIWKPVLFLYARDSKWNLTDKYLFPKGLYYVSNFGRFRCKNKIINRKPDKVGTITYRLLSHRFKLHEIILQTFYPEGNKDGLSPDHIDRSNRLDNRLCNLRWADRKTQYSNRKNDPINRKKVLCYNNGVVYDSARIAEKLLGLALNTVAPVARGDKKSIRGYTFKYL